MTWKLEAGLLYFHLASVASGTSSHIASSILQSWLVCLEDYVEFTNGSETY